MEEMNFLDFQKNHKGQTILLYPIPECPVGCLYCFEDKFRAAHEGYDKKAMQESLEKILIARNHPSLIQQQNRQQQLSHIILHGGEVFTLPLKDFEFFIKLIAKYQKQPAIQTSLFGMTSQHVKILKKYNVSVGVSLDGPAELNILRGPRNPDLNKKYQIEVAKNLKILQEAKIPAGIVTVVSKANAGSKEKLDKLIEWSRTKTEGGRFNIMFVPWFHSETEGEEEDHPVKEYALTEEEAIYAYIYLLEASFTFNDFQPAFVSEMIDNLLGIGIQSCQFSRCDYLTTKCITVMPNGLLARCDRCFQDGYYYISTTVRETQQRADVLGQTECKRLEGDGNYYLCRYWNVCGGGCPGEAEGQDYRHKTKNCNVYYAIYEKLEGIVRRMYPQVTLAIDLPPDYYYTYLSKGKFLNPDIKISRMNGYGLRMGELKEIGRNQQENLKQEAIKRNVAHIDEYRNVI